MHSTADDVNQFHTLMERLRATDLRPSPHVNAGFGALVELALQSGDLPDRIPADVVAECRRICSEGEAKLERHWAARVVADPACAEAFPYRANYRELAGYEAGAVRPHAPAPRRWAFVGSGPLPLSVVDLAEHFPDTTFVCLDIDPAASRWGRKVGAALGLAGRLEHWCADALDVDYGGFDVVTVAALVGQDADAKHALIDRIARTCPPHATIAVRSVPGDGRRLLYPRLGGWPQRCHSHGEPTPPPGVVNSVVLIHPPHHTDHDAPLLTSA